MPSVRIRDENAAGLVSKYVNTAYDNVKKVADDIDNVNTVAGKFSTGGGLLLTSPDGTVFEVTVSDAGALVVTEVT